MRGFGDLLRNERYARRFFGAYAQSALGTGAAYVALVLLAYERLTSPWAIALVLLADFVPPMLLGPVFGAAADRWPRRTCAIVGDLVRAGAFIGIALVDDFAATVVFALFAGVGTGVFKPAVMAGLPTIVSRDRIARATGLYGAITEIGYTAGPGIAGLLLLFMSPSTLLLVNGATFAVSAAVIAAIPLRAASGEEGETAPEKRRSLLQEAREGVALTVRMPLVRTAIVATSAILLFGGMVNVAELLLVRHLGGGHVAYSVLVTASGLGILVGTLASSRGGPLRMLESRFVAGLALFAGGMIATGFAPSVPVALAGVALAGVGNGFVITHERLLIQLTVDDALMGRVFGIQGALDGGAFGAAFVAGGAILSVVGPATVFFIAGGGGLLVWLGARAAFVSSRRRREALEVEAPGTESPPPMAAAGIER